MANLSYEEVMKVLTNEEKVERLIAMSAKEHAMKCFNPVSKLRFYLFHKTYLDRADYLATVIAIVSDKNKS